MAQECGREPGRTPVGTVLLRDDHTGFYFDQYTSALARNVDADPRVCLMAVDTGRLFWLRSLLAGRFIAPPGVRLYGTVGALRPATQPELAHVRRNVRKTQWLKGGKMLGPISATSATSPSPDSDRCVTPS